MTVTPSPQSVVVPGSAWERFLYRSDFLRGAAVVDGHDVSLRSFASLVEELKAAAAPAPSSLAGGEVLKALLDYIDIQTCTHESIKRGGAIWTICEDCGRKWADDEGGFKPHVDAPAVAAAREYLAALSPEAPARETEEDVEDTPWPESPLATALFRHVQSQFSLYDDEASEEAGEIIAILVKHGVDPTKLPARTPRHEAPKHRGLQPGDEVEFRDHPTEPGREVAHITRHEAPAEGAGEREEIARTLWISRGGLDRLFDEGAEWKNGNGFEQRQQCFIDADAILALRARSSAPEAREGEAVAYGADHQPWCQPGDQTQRAFRLRFEDPDMREMVWTGPEAEREALAAYNQYAPAWNVYLFSGHPRAAPSADKLRIAVEALEPFANLGVGSGPDDEHDTSPYRLRRGSIRKARQALAALKSEVTA